MIFETDSNRIIHLNNLEYIIIIYWPSHIKLKRSQESSCSETEERQFSLLQFGPSHFQNRIIVTEGRFMARHKNYAVIRLLFTVFTRCLNYRNCIKTPEANLGHAWPHMTSDLRWGFCYSQTCPCTNSSKLRKRFERVTKWNSRKPVGVDYFRKHGWIVKMNENHRCSNQKQVGFTEFEILFSTGLAYKCTP